MRPEAQTQGVALILDFRGFGFRLFTSLRPSDIKRGVASVWQH